MIQGTNECVNLASSTSTIGSSEMTPDDADMSDKSSEGGITVIYDNGDVCQEDQSRRYSLEVRVFCTNEKSKQG